MPRWPSAPRSTRVSTVLAVFFLGLAAGGYVFGERSPRIERPLRVYALLEMALALLDRRHAAALRGRRVALRRRLPLRGVAGSGSAVHAARVALVAPGDPPGPTLLMGGTLPLVCRQFVAARARLAASGSGSSTAVNTLGAAAGAALCGFVLLPSLGMRRALLIAAGLDLLAAALAVLRLRWQRTVPAAARRAARRRDAPIRSKQRRAVVALPSVCLHRVRRARQRGAVDALPRARDAEHGAHLHDLAHGRAARHRARQLAGGGARGRHVRRARVCSARCRWRTGSRRWC